MATEMFHQTKALNEVSRNIDNLTRVVAALNNTIVELVREMKKEETEITDA